MWIRMASFAVKPDEVEHLKSAYNGLAVPKVRAYAGNVGCLLLEPETAGDVFAAITIWRSREAAEAYESSGAAAEVVDLVRDCFAGPPTLASYWSESHGGLPS